MSTHQVTALEGGVQLDVESRTRGHPLRRHRFHFPLAEAKALHRSLGQAIDTAEFMQVKIIDPLPIPPPPRLSGNACGHCGNFSLRQAGTCQVCEACGETTGCS